MDIRKNGVGFVRRRYILGIDVKRWRLLSQPYWFFIKLTYILSIPRGLIVLKW